MRRAAAALLLAGCAAAPDDTAPAPDAALRERCLALGQRALEDNRAIATLASLCDAAPKRLAGTAGMFAAERWAAAQLRLAGCDEVRLEPAMVPHWRRGEEHAAVTAGGAMPLRVTALGGSVGTPADGVEAEVIAVRSFEQLEALGEQAKGKIVFFNRPMPRALRRTGSAYGSAVPQRSQGAVEAAKVGGVAALVRSMTTTIDGYPHTGAMRYQDGVPQVPAAAIATEDAEALAKLLEAGPVRVRLVLGCETLPDVEGHNVVGDLRGSQRPDEIVLIGGHLDAWDLGRGAHDDGAGCVHCIEAIRLLVATGWRPQRTIRVVLFANEENGLRGAKAYEQAHLAELDRHVAAIETDSGGFTPLGFGCSLDGAQAAAVQRLFAPLQELGAGQFVANAGAGGADIGALHAHGVPCFGLWVDGHRYFDYHHTAVDDLPAVNERELALGAAVIAYAAATLADR